MNSKPLKHERWQTIKNCNECQAQIQELTKLLNKNTLTTDDLHSIANDEQIRALNTGGGIGRWINRKSNNKRKKSKNFF